MQSVIEGIRRFHESRTDESNFLPDELVAAQSPDIILITCSDSRVVPTIVTRSGPGRMFVIRNAGNILPPPGVGSSEEGTIEYGICTLGIRHLVICGHTHCGAMAGLFDPELGDRLPAAARWLAHARHIERELSKRGLGPAEAVYENVLTQLKRAATYPAVVAAVEAGQLELHGWVYDIQSARFVRWSRRDDRFVDLLEVSDERRRA